MLRRTTIFLRDEDMKRMAALGEPKGLKPAQMVRLAIQDYIRQAARDQAAKKGVLGE